MKSHEKTHSYKGLFVETLVETQKSRDTGAVTFSEERKEKGRPLAAAAAAAAHFMVLYRWSAGRSVEKSCPLESLSRSEKSSRNST